MSSTPPPIPPGEPEAPAGLTPQTARPPSVWRRLGGFSGGYLATLFLGGCLFLALFDSSRQPMGCAVLQLVYVVPAVLFFFRRGRKDWALGFLFGGALVFLLASMCGGLANMH